jgi:hypothetical protein
MFMCVYIEGGSKDSISLSLQSHSMSLTKKIRQIISKF